MLCAGAKMKIIILLYAGPAILLFFWFIVCNHNSSRLLLLGAWILIITLVAVVGAVIWQTDSGHSKVASSIGLASGSIFIGPFLTLSAPKSWHVGWSIFATAVLPFLSGYFCLIALMLLGQVAVG
jgi:hypothetical protein